MKSIQSIAAWENTISKNPSKLPKAINIVLIPVLRMNLA